MQSLSSSYSSYYPPGLLEIPSGESQLSCLPSHRQRLISETREAVLMPVMLKLMRDIEDLPVAFDSWEADSGN